MVGRRTVSLPLWVVLGVVLILTLALVVPDQAAAIAALGGGLLLQALALTMGCGGSGGDAPDPGGAEGPGALRSRRRRQGGGGPARAPPPLRADWGRVGDDYLGTVRMEDQQEACHGELVDGGGGDDNVIVCGGDDEGAGGDDDGDPDGDAGGDDGGDARIARQGLGRNDPYRPLVGLIRRKGAIAPYYREELEGQERRVWWGNSDR